MHKRQQASNTPLQEVTPYVKLAATLPVGSLSRAILIHAAKKKTEKKPAKEDGLDLSVAHFLEIHGDKKAMNPTTKNENALSTLAWKTVGSPEYEVFRKAYEDWRKQMKAKKEEEPKTEGKAKAEEKPKPKPKTKEKAEETKVKVKAEDKTTNKDLEKMNDKEYMKRTTDYVTDDWDRDNLDKSKWLKSLPPPKEIEGSLKKLIGAKTPTAFAKLRKEMTPEIDRYLKEQAPRLPRDTFLTLRTEKEKYTEGEEVDFTSNPLATPYWWYDPKENQDPNHLDSNILVVLPKGTPILPIGIFGENPTHRIESDAYLLPSDLKMKVVEIDDFMGFRDIYTKVVPKKAKAKPKKTQT